MANAPYLLLPLSILALFLYLLSYLMSANGIIKKTLHRRIWNIILLTVFLTTAVLGILLAVQINYKLEWPVVKTLLKWHVNFGIALSIVAIFHFLWHWNYFRKIINPVKRNIEFISAAETHINDPDRSMRLPVLLSGFTATSVQVLLIREITTVFQGNELMMGWTLGMWMILTGTGTLLGRKSRLRSDPESTVRRLIALMGLSPVIMLVFMNLFRNSIFPPGVIINPFWFIIALLIILSPVCIVSGIAFSLFIKHFSRNKDGFISVYAFESAGSLAGGILVSLVVINWFSILQSLIVVLFIIQLLFYLLWKKRIHLVAGTGALVLFGLSVFLPVDRFLKSALYINQHVAETRETYYGNITVAENAGQKSFFENGSLLFTSEDIIRNEEFIHYAMLQREHPRNVLLIGGGICGMLSEILKYPDIDKIDYAELNPELIRISSKYLDLPDDSRINFIYRDGRKFIRETGSRYDMAILAIPDPESLVVNRFFTDEFMGILKDKLTRNGVFLISHSPVGNYVGDVMSEIEGSIYFTLLKNFDRIEIIPGERDFFVASDSVVSNQITQLLQKHSVENKYVNPYYIDDFLVAQRSRIIKTNIGKSINLNTDNRPLPVFYHSLRFLSGFSRNAILFLVIPLIALTFPVIFMKPVTAGIFSAGFAASSVELLLIFSFQTLFGYLYAAIGLIIGIFMGGLAAGSIICHYFQTTRRRFISAQLSLIIYIFLFPVILYLVKGNLSDWPGIVVFTVITLIISVITGFLYASGSKLLVMNAPGAPSFLYGIDLIGSAAGVLAVSVLLLPFLGLEYCCYLIGGLNILAVIFMLFKKP